MVRHASATARQADGSAQTGETFQGALGYTRRFRPKVAICDNVSGLLKRTYGCDAQIHLVREAFDEMGYQFAHAQVGARFLAPLCDARACECGLVGLR